MNAQFVSFWSGDYPQFAPAYAAELVAITGTMSATESWNDVFAAIGVVTDTAPITAAEVASTVRATVRMRTAMKSLDPKDTAERYAIEFQYGEIMAAITSATVTVQLLAGTDSTPEDLLDGAAQISGTSVYQRVKAGVSGCTYKLRCTAVNSGAGNETYVLTASLGVVTA